MCTLVTNMAQCGHCQTVIESTHRHDFVKCSCGNVSVDGGLSYSRTMFRPGSRWKDLSIYSPCNDETCPDKDLELSYAERVS